MALPVLVAKYCQTNGWWRLYEGFRPVEYVLFHDYLHHAWDDFHLKIDDEIMAIGGHIYTGAKHFMCSPFLMGLLIETECRECKQDLFHLNEEQAMPAIQAFEETIQSVVGQKHYHRYIRKHAFSAVRNLLYQGINRAEERFGNQENAQRTEKVVIDSLKECVKTAKGKDLLFTESGVSILEKAA